MFTFKNLNSKFYVKILPNSITKNFTTSIIQTKQK